MGKLTLLLVAAAAIGGTVLSASIRSSLGESSRAHAEGQADVAAREIALSAQGIALSRAVGPGGFRDPRMPAGTPLDGGAFDVEMAPGWTPAQATVVVRGRYGGAVHELQSTYRYDPMDAPGPLWLDVPYATGTADKARVSGGPPVYFDRRRHDALGLGSFLPLAAIENGQGRTSLARMADDARTELEVPEGAAWAGLLEDLNVDDTEGLYQAAEAAFDDARDARVPGPHVVTGSARWGTPDAVTVVEGDLTVTGTLEGSGALVVKGDLRVAPGATLNWTGLVVVRSTDDVLHVELDGDVSVTGAVAVTQDALPPGGHLDVSVYRQATGILPGAPWGDTASRPAPWTFAPPNYPFYQHTHAFDITPALAPRGSHVYFMEGAGAGRHGAETQFYNTLRSFGAEEVYLEFGNAEHHGYSRFTLDVAGTPVSGTVRTGFPAGFSHPTLPNRSATFRASDLRRFDVEVRSLRALKQAFDGPECASWPLCIGRDYDREDALAVRLVRARDGARLYESSLYWHMRTDEVAAHAAEEAAWRARIQAGEAFGTHLRLGRDVRLAYDRSPLADLAMTLGFDGHEVTLLQTASNHTPATQDLVCHVDHGGAERTVAASAQMLAVHLGHGDTLGACGGGGGSGGGSGGSGSGKSGRSR